MGSELSTELSTLPTLWATYPEKAAFQLEALQSQDIRRARVLIDFYADSRLDFIDTCIIAIAERLNIRRVGTLDKRDFMIIHPAHCDHCVLYPSGG